MRTQPRVFKRATVHPKYHQALSLQREKKHAEALHIFNQILAQDPDNSDALLSAAVSYTAVDQGGISIQLCERAVHLAPDMIEAWNNLGACYRKEHQRDRSVKAFLKALELDSNDTAVLNNLAAANINEGTPQEAVDYCAQALKIKPDGKSLHWNLSLALLELGRFKEAWPHYEYGLEMGDRNKRDHSLPIWEGQEGKKVVVYGEQGLGDEIMFAQYLPKLIEISEEVLIECHPRLVKLFRRAFPNCLVKGTRKDEKIHWLEEGMADYSIAMGSLPLYLGDFPKNPYLTAQPRKLDLPRPLIGIHWRGGHKKTRKDLRSIALMDLLPILRQDATFISLQYDPEADDEVEEFCRSTALQIHHWPQIVRAYDYDATASLVKSLDLVISVNTSIVHLCGALGHPAWVLTPKACAWRYGLTGDMPVWGECIKQIRQVNGWRDVIDDLAAQLSRWKTAA